MTTHVSLSALCDAAAFCLGNSYAREHDLLKQSPYPYREIKRLNALQKVCLTILRLAKHKPKPMVEIPVAIWNDIQLGRVQCLTGC